MSSNHTITIEDFPQTHGALDIPTYRNTYKHSFIHAYTPTYISTQHFKSDPEANLFYFLGN